MIQDAITPALVPSAVMLVFLVAEAATATVVRRCALAALREATTRILRRPALETAVSVALVHSTRTVVPAAAVRAFLAARVLSIRTAAREAAVLVFLAALEASVAAGRPLARYATQGASIPTQAPQVSMRASCVPLGASVPLASLAAPCAAQDATTLTLALLPVVLVFLVAPAATALLDRAAACFVPLALSTQIVGHRAAALACRAHRGPTAQPLLRTAALPARLAAKAATTQTSVPPAAVLVS